MKPKIVLSLVIGATLHWQAASVFAAAFTEARVTRLENDVKLLKEGAAPRTAVVGDAVTAVSSVATGPASRLELQFPDKSVTRLGANSRMTIRGEQRTLDLDQGVVFLQVPKQMGGAKIRTGAVTAAVTGTTVIVEALPGNAAAALPLSPEAVLPRNSEAARHINLGGIKLIVIEGTVDLFRTDKPSDFRTIHAGEMVLMKKDDPNVPQGTPVDVKLMLKTGNKFFQEIEGTPNAAKVLESVQQQQNLIASGGLQQSNIIIPGRGALAHVMDHSSNVAQNAILVHAVKNGNGKNNLVNLLGPGNSALGALNGNGNGNAFGQGKGKGQGNGNAFGQGKGNGNGGVGQGKGKGGGNGNGNANNNNNNGGGPPPGGPPGVGPKKKI
jgi:hypothetical protein